MPGSARIAGWYSGGAALASLALCCAVAADGAPHRQFGRWEQQLTLDDGSYAIPVSQMCVDAKTEPRLTLVGAQMDRAQCTAYRIEKKVGGGWSFYSVCSLGARGHVTTSGSVTGDFKTGYEVDASGVTSDAPDPKMNSTHRLTIKAKWLGPCLPGETGGDVTTSGKTTNVFSGGVN